VALSTFCVQSEYLYDCTIFSDGKICVWRGKGITCDQTLKKSGVFKVFSLPPNAPSSRLGTFQVKDFHTGLRIEFYADGVSTRVYPKVSGLSR
jgi:hypothetical protein